jgi:hypothetical protein
VVVVNELLADPTGPDEGQEWVELYNAGEAVDLTGWALEAGTSTPSAQAELGGTLAAGGFLVVEGSLGLGNAGSSADVVRLVDAGGVVVDTVVYGSPNSDGFVDDGGELVVAAAPAPEPGLALARRVDGADSDDSAADFWLAEPTPGAANPVPAPCVLGEVRINELLPDPEGEDEGQEWVELYALGEPLPLDGWTLSLLTRTGSGSAVPLSGSIDRFLVPPLAGSLGNGTGGDGIVLLDCAGEVVDQVAYGEPNEDLPELGPSAGDPGPDQVLARREDGEEGWEVRSAGSPGVGNHVDEPALAAVELGGGCGGPPAPSDPPRGCAGGACLPALALALRWPRRRVTPG